MSNQKLSAVAQRSQLAQDFTPGGFVDAKGVFVPLIKVRGARHAIGIGTALMIENDYAAFIAAAVAACDPEHEAAMRAAQAEAARLKAEAEAEAEAVPVPTNPPVRQGTAALAGRVANMGSAQLKG